MIELNALTTRSEVLKKERLTLACLTGGLAASAAYNAAGAHRPDGKAFTPEDFMPRGTSARDDHKQTPEELLERIREWNAAFDGIEVVN